MKKLMMASLGLHAVPLSGLAFAQAPGSGAPGTQGSPPARGARGAGDRNAGDAGDAGDLTGRRRW